MTDVSMAVDVVFIYFSKDFATVSQGKLIQKIGAHGDLVDWNENWPFH